MDVLVDKADRKKVRLLRTVFEAERQTCPLDSLAASLGVSNQTVLKLVEAIKEDIVLFDFAELVVFDYSSTNLLFTLQFSESVNLQMFLNAYIRKSIKFRLLEALFHHSFDTLQQLADFLDIPYIQVRRKIQEINSFLNRTSLSISAKGKVSLHGNEIDIRFFYTVLFVTGYGAEKWPFRAYSFLDMSEVLDACPKEIYALPSLDKFFLVHYFLGVHLFRERQGRLVKKEEVRISLYTPYSAANRLSFSRLSKEMKRFLPRHSDEYLKRFSQLLCSALVAMGGYHSIKAAPDFLLRDSQIKEMGVPGLAFHLLDRLDHHLYNPLSSEERSTIHYALLCLHYRIFFVGTIVTHLKDIFTDYLNVDKDRRKRHKIKQIKRIIALEMQTAEFKSFENYKEYLATEYCLIYDRHIHLEKYTAPINISFLTALSKQTIQEEVLHYFSTYYNLHVVNTLSTEVDLIISDIPLSSSVIPSLRLNKPIVYCHMQLIDSDYDKIAAALSAIAKKKFKLSTTHEEDEAK